MKTILSIAALSVLLASCQTDETRKSKFAGQYQVTLELPKATKKEMAKAKKEVEKELSKAKEEIREGIETAQGEIETELGEYNHFGNAVSNFVEGMGELAQGLTDLGEHLGKMGIDLGQGIVDGLQFKAEFRDDGSVHFGKKSNIQISGNSSSWDIRDGKLYLGDGGGEKPFEMKKLGEGKWDLVREDVILHLERI